MSIGGMLLGHGHNAPIEYHRTMLDDYVRMDAFERAIRALVKPGDVVLDIGTGTGILAMLAAKRGARKVYAIESAPVGAVAEQLAVRNRLDEVVTVIRGDFLDLQPIEPVDLVISEFLGRFVIDDGMVPLLLAASTWLKPEARFCPANARMLVAPVVDVGLRSVERFVEPMYGIDLKSGADYARHAMVHAGLLPRQVAATPQCYAQIVPPFHPGPMNRELEFSFEKAGTFVALAGWFDSELAPGLLISTEPGVPTHWQQVLFPVEPRAVEAGDRLRFRLERAENEIGSFWRWQGEISGTHGTATFQGDSLMWWREVEAPLAPLAPLPQGAQAALHARDQAMALLSAGDAPGSMVAMRSAVAALTPAEDELAPRLYEELGVACYEAGKLLEAVPALLRALDGSVAFGAVPVTGAEPRAVALRVLCTAFVRLGEQEMARMALEAFESRFGPHPELRRRG